MKYYMRAFIQEVLQVSQVARSKMAVENLGYVMTLGFTVNNSIGK